MRESRGKPRLLFRIGREAVLRRRGIPRVPQALEDPAEPVDARAQAVARRAVPAEQRIRRRRVERVVVHEFEFVNPHPFVTVDLKEKGERWRLEMDNRWELAELGFTAGTLKRGDAIVVIVNPARTESRRGYIRRLDRPVDGFKYEHHR